jgi:GNAT superfamily N-acetyltransferase
MSPLNISVSLVEEVDYRLIAGFIADAKLPLIINRLLWKDWPNHTQQLALYIKTVEGASRDPSVQSLKVVDNESGEIVGHLALTRREADKANSSEPQDEEKPKVPDGLNPVVSSAVTKAVKEADTTNGVERFGEINILLEIHDMLTLVLELTHVFVPLAHRNRGIGSHLIKMAIDQAKAAGLPLFLQSTPEEHQFFSNLGFKDTRHADIDLTQWAPANSGFGNFRLSGMVLTN